MWENDGRQTARGHTGQGQTGQTGQRGQAGQTGEMGQTKRPQKPYELPRPERSDTLEPLPFESDLLAEEFPGATPDVASPSWYRQQTRRCIREFLSVVPRSEPDAALSFVRPDGTPRLVTRGQFTAAIDGMRPRLRRIVRLAVEERWPRQRVCEYLNNISLKTFERDHAEAMDILEQL